jgi:hypothetical protein
VVEIIHVHCFIALLYTHKYGISSGEQGKMSNSKVFRRVHIPGENLEKLLQNIYDSLRMHTATGF